MIDLDDLMRGNLVVDRTSKKTCVVTHVGEFVRLDGCLSYRFKNELDPVVVTEKVLLGFGFRRVEYPLKNGKGFFITYTRPMTEYFICWDREGSEINTKKLCISIGVNLGLESFTIKRPIKSQVHLLQNYWRMFTEQKLTV